MSNIIVIAEVRAGSLKRPSLETITAAQQLASANGGQVIAIACGNGSAMAGSGPQCHGIVRAGGVPLSG